MISWRIVDLEQLQLFRAIATARSISKGAQIHGVTQSAASQSVQELERSLEVQLLDRAHRPLEITPAGHLLYEFSRDILRRRQEFDAALSELRGRAAGTVRVASIYSVGLSEMGRLEEAFHQRLPEGKLEVDYLRPEHVYEYVHDDRADLGLVSYPAPARDLEVLNWREEPMVLACAPAHPLARMPRVRMADLDGADFIGFDADLPISRHIERFLRENGVHVHLRLHFDNIQSMKEALREGRAVSILPEPVLRAETAAGVLRAVALTPLMLRPLGILYRRRRALPRAVRVFLEVLRAPSN
jgi:DNA-binding transcriptional LysR family regulator